MKPGVSGGLNIAMKVPAHQYDAVVLFYRETLGLPEIEGRGDVSFIFGSNRLWIDCMPQLSQAEVWLEIVTDDFIAGSLQLERAGIARNDALEPLPQEMLAGWFFNPAGIVHLLRQKA